MENHRPLLPGGRGHERHATGHLAERCAVQGGFEKSRPGSWASPTASALRCSEPWVADGRGPSRCTIPSKTRTSPELRRRFVNGSARPWRCCLRSNELCSNCSTASAIPAMRLRLRRGVPSALLRLAWTADVANCGNCCRGSQRPEMLSAITRARIQAYSGAATSENFDSPQEQPPSPPAGCSFIRPLASGQSVGILSDRCDSPTGN